MAPRAALLAIFLCTCNMAVAQDRELVLTLQFDSGSATLRDEQRARLDAIRQSHPPDQYLYWFEGDFDSIPFVNHSHRASLRLNERLAESRWQAAAFHLQVEPRGLVRFTGRAEARVYVERKPTGGAESAAYTRTLADSLARLQSEVDQLRREINTATTPAEPETVLAVARLEAMWARTDKWLAERWWEAGLGIELGLFRGQPERPGRRTGATLAVSNGTFAFAPLEVTTRLDFVRLGWDGFGITPSLRWYDWSLRVHAGDDSHAAVSLASSSDPIYLVGIDLDAQPLDGTVVRLAWAGVGTRVHAIDRELLGYDHYDLRLDQRLSGRWWLEGRMVYDERFEKSVAYGGAWIAHGWRMRAGELSLRVGFVEQLDAYAATNYRPTERHVSTLSFGLGWNRRYRFARW